MIFIMIASMVLSLVIVIASFMVLGRNAVIFARTVKKVQYRVEPMVLKLTRMVDIIQNRALSIADRSAILQRRVYLLSFSLNKLKIILEAWQKAMEPINRARDYVGL